MKINYNSLFYNQHKYRTGSRNGIESYNDTKWVDINERYSRLANINSDLLNEQPFGVIGNNKGFDKLIDLLSYSNYSFEDVDKALIDTYNVSFKNAMSRMVVNTHAVIASFTSNDDNVMNDIANQYYIITAPFNQMHFGERDEFIRQKLSSMYNTRDNNYIPIDKFNGEELSSILGFTIICTVNGLISNDCFVAIDDKGFHFKIGWSYSSDVEFIIYKLDKSFVYRCSIPTKYVINGTIPYSNISSNITNDMIGKKCLVNVFDKNYTKTIQSSPNFGVFGNNGFQLINTSQRTLSTLLKYDPSSVELEIFVLNYIHEVPNVFPAVNYYDVVETHKMYTDKDDQVFNMKGNPILVSESDTINDLEICTPPITLNHSSTLSFSTIISCLSLHNDLLEYESTFKSVGNVLTSDMTYATFEDKVKYPLRDILGYMKSFYAIYLRGAILTALVPDKSIKRFESLLNSINSMCNVTDLDQVQLYTIDEYYGDNYKFFVDAITLPFQNNVLSNFGDLKKISKNYFENDNSKLFMRPVSEQSFIALKYNKTTESWMFANPKIKHFHGIDNTFYIADNLKGDEIYKFFVLYSETDSPSETSVNTFTENIVSDFDKFYSEVEKHIGYIRYWYAENQLLKLSKIMYNNYSDDSCIHVLSKILKRKTESTDLLDIYPSDINYELSNITTDNLAQYDENSDRAPFTINFMFYTLAMLNGNEDKLQSYFYRKLASKKFENRYADVMIDDVLKSEDNITYPINYSNFSLAPNTIDISASTLPVANNKLEIFYGLPMIISNNTNTGQLYRYTFNDYSNTIKHFMLSDNDIDTSYYLKFNNVNDHEYKKFKYNNDINVCQLIMLYLNYVTDTISGIQTFYDKSYNQTSFISSGIEAIQYAIDKIRDYVPGDMSFNHQSSLIIINSIITSNPVISILNNMSDIITNINTCKVNGRNVSIIEYVNKLITTLHATYINTGFDIAIQKRARKLYIHLKKINTKLNVYQLKEWLSDIDLQLLYVLDKYIATYTNVIYSSRTFLTFYNVLNTYIPTTIAKIDTLYSLMYSTTLNTHISTITEYCVDIIKNYYFDLFSLENISYDNTKTYTTKPHLLKMTLTNDNHFHPSNITDTTTEINLIFKPIIDKVNSVYHITSIANVCEYAFFNGTKIDNCSMLVLDENGNTVSTLTVSLNFLSISNSSNITNSFNQLNNIQTTVLDFPNNQETLVLNADGTFVSEARTKVNYELMIGNHYDQLSSVHESILDQSTMKTKFVDRICINNQTLNNLVNLEYTTNSEKRVFFKPSQIIHIDLNDTDNSLTSIGGKYFVGQTIYMSTDDGLATFPANITAIDKSINKGFIEAEIDQYNTTWFETNDDTVITKYLSTNVECTVIDDNIRNFLSEFSNDDYEHFSNIWFNTNLNVSDDIFDDKYSLPGDPIFVSKNTDFVYSRLNWFFNDLVPNKFIDDEHKKMQFYHAGTGFISDNTLDHITLNVLNHSFCDMTNPEIYPILRDELNDHEVRRNEINKFNQCKTESMNIILDMNKQLLDLYKQLANADNDGERSNIISDIENVRYKLSYQLEFQKRMDTCIEHLEPETTWFNVRSYEDAVVYINNGRAKLSPTFIPNIRDVPYTDKLQIFIYDWEHKYWINPNTYTVSSTVEDVVKIQEYDNYTTNNVMYSIRINPTTDFVPSKKLLIYFAYDKSDIFESITMNDMKCLVKFKPTLVLNSVINSYDPYSDINIRKNFDGIEKYSFTDFNSPEDFSINEAYYIKRPKRNSDYIHTPIIRLCDILLVNDLMHYDFSSVELYVRMPFVDITTKPKFNVQFYATTINQPIISFKENQIVKLICIQNNSNSSYDGNVSSVMFECVTSLNNYDNTPELTVFKSSLPHDVSGSFVCTILRDNMNEMRSGIITVDVTIEQEELIDENNAWIMVPRRLATYRELPDEFIIVPHETMYGATEITFENRYIKDSNDFVNVNNQNVRNPFDYYFDTVNKTRLPISDVYTDSYNKRLTINTTTNTNIKVVRSTHLSVCRYSKQIIPENGFIDLTGYIPTPLSRERYEFWVNGRMVKDVIILSPTSFQLCNLKSLRNLDVIELVDDAYDSELMKQDNVYIDITGKVYSSYEQAMLNNALVTDQFIRFTFGINNKSNDTICMVTDPNNHNIETDILSNISLTETMDSYDQLSNIPTINGISIYHPTITSLGINEIPNDMILDMMDDVWKYERLTNRDFDMYHDNNRKEHIEIKQKQRDNSITAEDMFVVYITGNTEKSFSLYITNNSSDQIDDINNTLEIIPFIKVGVYVLIDNKYSGKWIHSTIDNSNVIKLK